jgi:hypothetical protein
MCSNGKTRLLPNNFSYVGCLSCTLLCAKKIQFVCAFWECPLIVTESGNLWAITRNPTIISQIYNIILRSTFYGHSQMQYFARQFCFIFLGKIFLFYFFSWDKLSFNVFLVIIYIFSSERNELWICKKEHKQHKKNKKKEHFSFLISIFL